MSAAMSVDLPFLQAITIPVDAKLVSLYEKVFEEKSEADKKDFDRSLGGAWCD